MSTDLTANPGIWPECDCGVPFVHRLAFTWGGDMKWVWQRDCKHPKRETHEHRLMTADGPYLQPGEAA